jgi:predicted nuclease of restriction endonuclease-like (RecB) superfamily
MKRKHVPKAIVHQPAAQFYYRFVESIKKRIRTAQIKAALAANAQLVLHYWEIGRDILASQKREGWGARVIDRLANDLQQEFPKLSGYSARNLKYMRAFAEAWPDREIVQQLAAQIPWGQNCVLLDRVKDAFTREFYIRKTVEHGWSRSILIHQLDTKLHKRLGKAPSNFALTLPSPNPISHGRFSKIPTSSNPRRLMNPPPNAHSKKRCSTGLRTSSLRWAPVSLLSATSIAWKWTATNFSWIWCFITHDSTAMS